MNSTPYYTLPKKVQELRNKWGRIVLSIGQDLRDMGIHPPARIVVGFSGGADSTALAVMLHCLGFELILAHLDHSLRAESVAEAEHARRVASSLGVPCHVQTLDIADLAKEAGHGVEQAGRNARYALFDKVRQRHNAPWLATGHHLDDLCEDVLLRLVRGTGWPALGGMTAVDSARCLVRPLLSLRHGQLMDFLQAHGISWMEDASNAEPHGRRNRMRHHVMPLLLAENPNLPQAVLELNHMACQDDEYWQNLLAPYLAHVQALELPRKGLVISRQQLDNLDKAVLSRLLVQLIRQCPKGQARASTVRRIVEVIQKKHLKHGHPNVHSFQLPGNNLLLLTKDELTVLFGQNTMHE